MIETEVMANNFCLLHFFFWPTALDGIVLANGQSFHPIQCAPLLSSSFHSFHSFHSFPSWS